MTIEVMPSMLFVLPPAEAHSLVIRIADGCPWNQCTFCGMYKGVECRFQTLEEMEVEIARAQKEYPLAKRIFLADGDAISSRNAF